MARFASHRPGIRALALSVLLFLLMWGPTVLAQAPNEPVVADPIDTVLQTAPDLPAPATSVQATDHKYDDGETVELTWQLSPDDVPTDGTVIGYEIYRSTNGDSAVKIADAPAGATEFLDERAEIGVPFTYYVRTVGRTGFSDSEPSTPISPDREWINYNRKWLFLIALLISASVIYFIETTKRGKKLFIRKIAGLDAVDDAIGRATEMGRPILFIPGIQDMDNPQTIAALTILGRISRTIADYDTRISMPVSRSLVMTAARETIKTSYMAAGRPDAYNDDMVHYVTDEQFGYVAAVDGIMVRQKPATCFYLGAFFAESLIMAETGNSIGAIQIAGTAMPAQLPFFVAACDFTLIGEELFAASAYLSGEPKQLGSLKGQDVGKGLAMGAILLGVLAATLALAWNVEFMASILEFLTSVFQTN